ncbi:nicotinate-nucleotide adenylyltransferase [Kamptonema cortianum]|nr:nicotinate-nucleotide adenylyltransferase [Kamptonema cortianum]MDL5055554.1 nicotinate-nucleotide adenylyltransferase [Oscillatoria laete-virens NRMC-F 0139]
MRKTKKKFKRIGLFGGTFDPVHNGHLLLAMDAIEQCALDHLFFVPSANPPHKWAVHLDARSRDQLVRAAVKGISQISVSDMELRRRGVSYTWLTLAAMKKEFPHAELFWIIGADNVKEIAGWRHPERIARDCTLIIAARPGSRIDPRKLRGFRFKRLRARAIDISSTEIRARAAANLSIHGLVPAGVECLISKTQAYAPEKVIPHSQVQTRKKNSRPKKGKGVGQKSGLEKTGSPQKSRHGANGPAIGHRVTGA